MPRSNRKDQDQSLKGIDSLRNLHLNILRETILGTFLILLAEYKSSAKKLDFSTLENQTVDTETNYEHDYNVIVNFSILQTIITKYSSCPECKNTLSLNNNLKRKRGLCLLFELTCIHCDWKNEFETSFEIAVDSALLEFNNGATGLYGVLKGCGIKYGRFMDLATKRKDGIHVRNMELKSSKAGLNRRKKL